MIYIIVYSYVIEKIKFNSREFFVWFTPIYILLVMIISLQNNVGTDYHSYIRIAEGLGIERYLERGEILFYIIGKVVVFIERPQMIFLVLGIIQISFLGLICCELRKYGYKLYRIMFLYFSLNLIFFNQFNGIRQYTAVYIIIYAVLLLLNQKKLKFISYIVIASLFHKSAIFFIVFVFVRKILFKEWNKKIVYILLGIAFIISFLDISIVIDAILSKIQIYSNYIGRDYLQPMSLNGKITKIIKIIPIIYCYSKIYKMKKEIIPLNNMAILGLLVMIVSFSSGIIWRVYQYFDFFIMIPVLNYWQGKGKNINIINFYLIAILIAKIILFPKGEYLYNSIL